MDIETAKTAFNLAMEIENLSSAVTILSSESSIITLQINENGRPYNPINAFNTAVLQMRLKKVLLKEFMALHDQTTNILEKM